MKSAWEMEASSCILMLPECSRKATSAVKSCSPVMVASPVEVLCSNSRLIMAWKMAASPNVKLDWCHEPGSHEI